MQSKKISGIRRMARIVSVIGLLGAAAHMSVAAASIYDTDAVQAQVLESWHQTMRQMPPMTEGCFHATYPSLMWEKASCGTTSYRSTPPVTSNAVATVGDGADYAAGTANLSNAATGSFPVATGVTSISNNSYTMQLNTNLAGPIVIIGGSSSPASPACKRDGYTSCDVWEQFIYESGSRNGSAFIQNWMFIPAGAKCLRGWFSYNTSQYNGCYRNSKSVSVPSFSPTQLANVKLAATVAKGGNDTVTFTNGTNAYAVSEKDAVLGVSYVWNQSEFNLVGNGGGSQAKFNSGSSLTVNLQVNDGSTNAPSCLANAGTTGETNNLNLGPCSVAGGGSPYIQFTESN